MNFELDHLSVQELVTYCCGFDDVSFILLSENLSRFLALRCK